MNKTSNMKWISTTYRLPRIEEKVLVLSDTKPTHPFISQRYDLDSTWFPDSCDMEGFDTFEAMAKIDWWCHLPKESEWISVQERLPKVGENVLVRRNPNSPYITCRKNAGDKDLSIDENGFWSSCYGAYKNVTHWCPIPESPHAEESRQETKEDERVSHPSHYAWMKKAVDVEPIEICRLFDFNLGNALKYIFRAGHKHEDGMTDREKYVQDLEKAIWYINDEISTLKSPNKP